MENEIKDYLYKGRIVFYNAEKGYGFIRVENSSRDKLFFHKSKVNGETEPERRQRVGFNTIKSNLKGSYAVDIDIIPEG